MPTFGGDAGDDLRPGHVDGVRQRRRRRSAAATEFVQLAHAARAGRASGTSRPAACRCASRPPSSPCGQDHVEGDRGPAGVRRRARGRARAPDDPEPTRRSPRRSGRRSRACCSAQATPDEALEQRRRRRQRGAAATGMSAAVRPARSPPRARPRPRPRPARSARSASTPSAWLYVLPGGDHHHRAGDRADRSGRRCSASRTRTRSPRRRATSGSTTTARCSHDPDFARRRPAHADLHGAVRPAQHRAAGSGSRCCSTAASG